MALRRKGRGKEEENKEGKGENQITAEKEEREHVAGGRGKKSERKKINNDTRRKIIDKNRVNQKRKRGK